MNCPQMILATAYLVSAPICADDDPLDLIASALPVELRSITWSADQSIRIVIFQGGFEHVTTPVYIQWIAPHDPRAEPTLLASKRLVQLDFYSCSDPVIEYSAQGTVATLTATHTYEGTDTEVIVRIGTVGEASVEMHARSN